MMSPLISFFIGVVTTLFLLSLPKMVEIISELLKSKINKYFESKKIVEQNLDPILKSLDELAAKLYSIIIDDFKYFSSNKSISELEIPADATTINTLYLFAQFWCRLEIFRKESLFVNMSKDKRGKKIIDFIYCIESNRIQILRRSVQRAIGETLIVRHENRYECMDYKKFAELLISKEEIEKWLDPLHSILCKSFVNTQHRQKIVKYFMILHAMIDTLDYKHESTRNRKSLFNKLNVKSKRDLKYRVFKKYLSFIPNPKFYYSGIKSERHPPFKF